MRNAAGSGKDELDVMKKCSEDLASRAINIDDVGICGIYIYIYIYIYVGYIAYLHIS